MMKDVGDDIFSIRHRVGTICKLLPIFGIDTIQKFLEGKGPFFRRAIKNLVGFFRPFHLIIPSAKFPYPHPSNFLAEHKLILIALQLTRTFCNSAFQAAVQFQYLLFILLAPGDVPYEANGQIIHEWDNPDFKCGEGTFVVGGELVRDRFYPLKALLQIAKVQCCNLWWKYVT